MATLWPATATTRLMVSVPSVGLANVTMSSTCTELPDRILLTRADPPAQSVGAMLSDDTRTTSMTWVRISATARSVATRAARNRQPTWRSW